MPACPYAAPPDPIAASTHDDPRRYYAELAEQGLHYDPQLRSWVAASQQAARAVFADPTLRVRPAAEPVPAALHGTMAGQIFAALVRMRDDVQHVPLKLAVQSALTAFASEAIQNSVQLVANRLAPTTPHSAAELTRLLYALPSAVLGYWFGIAETEWHALAAEVQAFVRCIAPGGTPEEITAGCAAAERLEQRLRGQLTKPGPLLQRLSGELEAAGLPDPDWLLVANAIGLLFQACEGCAGLMGLALLQVQQEPALSSHEVLERVLHQLPPIQNTRRFAAEAVELAACPLQAGDSVLVLLSAPDPDGQAALAFGHGRHACPGERWAKLIAQGGLDHLRQTGLNPELLQHHQWRRSLNARVPEFYRRRTA
jgi:cytochrome P450